MANLFNFKLTQSKIPNKVVLIDLTDSDDAAAAPVPSTTPIIVRLRSSSVPARPAVCKSVSKTSGAILLDLVQSSSSSDASDDDDMDVVVVESRPLSPVTPPASPTKPTASFDFLHVPSLSAPSISFPGSFPNVKRQLLFADESLHMDWEAESMFQLATASPIPLLPESGLPLAPPNTPTKVRRSNDASEQKEKPRGAALDTDTKRKQRKSGRSTQGSAPKRLGF